MDRHQKKRNRARDATPFDDDVAAAGHRHVRLETLVFEELAATLRDEVRDRSLEDVRLLRVELSADYANARVVYTCPLEARAPVERAFARATGFLRARLGDALELKRVPELRFVRGEAIAGNPEEDDLLHRPPCTPSFGKAPTTLASWPTDGRASK